MRSSTLLAVLAFASSGFAYQQVWNFDASNFWNNFEFVNSPDTAFTNGFAQYVSEDEAISSGLARINDNKVRIGVDAQNRYSESSTGRKSVRLQSYGTFDKGLLVADFAHVPVAGCGMWPAFWVYRGEQSAQYSEIDIFENVNLETSNSHSFYTNNQCTVNIRTGDSLKGNDCTYSSGAGGGCSFLAEPNTFNQPFNDNYRVIALQVESDGIKIWHFRKNEVPGDLNSNPNPANWKTPTVHLTPNNCDFNSAFSRFHVIINITFCGGWAGDTNEWNRQCGASTGVPTCKTWVANNPDDFTDTFFEFNSIKLFQR